MPPRWLVDEMLGRLARYLRFVGCDTAYARGVRDDELLDRARREGRVLLTRDRELARRSPSALLLTTPELAEQWRAVRRAWPDVPSGVEFVRCSLCNGTLELEPSSETVPSSVPEAIRRTGAPVYRCRECGHRYWEGSHTAAIRQRLAAWSAEGR